MKYLQLSTVEVVLTRHELESFREKFGDGFQNGNFIFIRFSELNYSKEWFDKFFTFFGGIDQNRTEAIFIDCYKSTE